MTIVVPSWVISAMLDDGKLKRQREVRDAKPERRLHAEE
jgi:hypothetical protein